MPNTKFEKNSQEWNMFADYYKLCQQYWIIEKNSERYWESLVEDIQKFYEKYKDISLSRKIAMALVNDLEEKSKQK